MHRGRLLHSEIKVSIRYYDGLLFTCNTGGAFFVDIANGKVREKTKQMH